MQRETGGRGGGRAVGSAHRVAPTSDSRLQPQQPAAGHNKGEKKGL